MKSEKKTLAWFKIENDDSGSMTGEKGDGPKMSRGREYHEAGFELDIVSNGIHRKMSKRRERCCKITLARHMQATAIGCALLAPLLAKVGQE